jgi:NAD(P)-dependent dehydrogenase (short-subunit alcohol dehydrogenase family)
LFEESDLMTLQNRVVVVTGGGTGIGQAAAIQFAEAGAWVVAVGRRAAPLEETARRSDRIFAVTADILADSDRERIINHATSRWGRIDVLVNNAGRFIQRSLEKFDAQGATSLFATNVLGPSLLSQATLPLLKDSQGAIVNVSSTFGQKAAPLISHYAASKAALDHLTRCWALELAPYQIRVNAVAPGPTETGILEDSDLPAATVEQIKREEADRIPLQRRGAPHDVAAWIVHLANPAASWVTGQVIGVDGGLAVA